MCIKFNIYHSGGSSIVNVNDYWLLQKLFVYYRYKFNSELISLGQPTHGFLGLLKTVWEFILDE